MYTHNSQCLEADIKVIAQALGRPGGPAGLQAPALAASLAPKGRRRNDSSRSPGAGEPFTQDEKLCFRRLAGWAY